MYSYFFRHRFRQYLTVRTVEKFVNKINVREFESNLKNTFCTECTTTQIDDKNGQKNQQASGEFQDRIVSKIESVFKCNNKQATEIFNVLKTPHSNPNLSDIVTKVKWLRRRNIQLPTILDNYKLLLRPFGNYFSVFIN